MKTYSLAAAAAVAIAVSSAAFAEGASYDHAQPAAGVKTRAEVGAELQQARAQGTLRATEAALQQDTPIAASRSRADVRAEAIAASRSGELREMTEDSNAFTITLAGNGVATPAR
jgi:hypothetical protein